MAHLPNNLVYAVYRNLDHAVINTNGIFAEHIKHTHSTDKSVRTPDHTLNHSIGQFDLEDKWKTIRRIPASWHSVWLQCKQDMHQDVKTGTRRKKSKKYVDPFLKLPVQLYPLDVHLEQ
jgi:hypothetical protein